MTDSGNISSNNYGTVISSGISTGSNSEIPTCWNNDIQGGFMIFDSVYSMLNLYQNKRRAGMLVFLRGYGPMNQAPNSFYILQGSDYIYTGADGNPNNNPPNINNPNWQEVPDTSGALKGPSNIIDYLYNQTLTIYDKEVLGLTYSANPNSDDGTKWLRMNFGENGSDGTGGGGTTSTPGPILSYYSGCTIGADIVLTSDEIKTLTESKDNVLQNEYTITNNYTETAPPYLALPLSFTNNKYIKQWTISGLVSNLTDDNRSVVKMMPENKWYALYRITGSLDPLQSVTISGLVLEDTPIRFIGNSPVLPFPYPDSGKYGLLYDANGDYFYFNSFTNPA